MTFLHSFVRARFVHREVWLRSAVSLLAFSESARFPPHFLRASPKAQPAPSDSAVSTNAETKLFGKFS